MLDASGTVRICDPCVMGGIGLRFDEVIFVGTGYFVVI